MPLFLVPTPLGNLKDITLRSLETLKKCPIWLVESPQVARTLYRVYQMDHAVEIFELNEHSKQADWQKFMHFCAQKNVALMSDAGTPNFQDPGAELLHECYKNNIPVISLPGPSSLTATIALSHIPLKTFYFAGFLPTKTHLRAKKWHFLKKIKDHIIVMDTPYRLKKTLQEIAVHLPTRSMLLALDISLDSEKIYLGTAQGILSQLSVSKGEFVAIIFFENREPTNHNLNKDVKPQAR